MGETKNHHFYDLGIFEPTTKPQNQQFLSSETPGHLKQIKTKPKPFVKDMFINLGILKLQFLDTFRKDRHRNMMKIRLNKSLKSWIWDQHLPENMK